MSTATIELSSSRQKLFEALGESQSAYVEHMKLWFRKKCSKEEFDSAARKLLSKDVIYLHNQFLLAILNKCQTLVNLTPGPSIRSELGGTININQELLSPSKFDASADRLKKGKIKRKVKPNKPQLEYKFQSVSTSLCAPEVTVVNVSQEEKDLQFLAREKTLPDVSLIHGRLLVAAWEEGLEGVEDEAVSLTLAAVEQQLRRLVTSLVTSRNSWRQFGGIKCSAGVPAPDPWLLNTQTKRDQIRNKDGGAALQASIGYSSKFN